jgi:hypothetical protein
MATRMGGTERHAAQTAQRSAKDDALKSGIEKALKATGSGKRVHQAFRHYKNLDVAGAGCGCGCGTVKKKK